MNDDKAPARYENAPPIELPEAVHEQAYHEYQEGNVVWWLYERSRVFGFAADVPAVVTHARRDILTIRVTNVDGRTMWADVHPVALRPRENV